VLRDVAMATNFWLSMGYNFGCMIARDSLTCCLILGVGFRGQAVRWKHRRDEVSKGCCHGNQFWD